MQTMLFLRTWPWCSADSLFHFSPFPRVLTFCFALTKGPNIKEAEMVYLIGTKLKLSPHTLREFWKLNRNPMKSALSTASGAEVPFLRHFANFEWSLQRCENDRNWNVKQRRIKTDPKNSLLRNSNVQLHFEVNGKTGSFLASSLGLSFPMKLFVAGYSGYFGSRAGKL